MGVRLLGGTLPGFFAGTRRSLRKAWLGGLGGVVDPGGAVKGVADATEAAEGATSREGAEAGDGDRSDHWLSLRSRGSVMW